MSYDFLARKAVTLVELLIVIVIMVTLATLGLGAYRYAKVNIEADLEADKLIARLESFREKSKKEKKCFGMRFWEGSVEPEPIETNYLNPKDGCESLPPEFILVHGLEKPTLVLDGTAKPMIDVLFSPPRGDVVFTPSDGEMLEITRWFGNNEQGSERIILISKTSGTIQKK